MLLAKRKLLLRIIKKHITVLHTNDTHSHIDPLPVDDPHYPDKGGVARRAVLINQVRKENPNTLLFDAGDIFQGTPYFNYYGGELRVSPYVHAQVMMHATFWQSRFRIMV